MPKGVRRGRRFWAELVAQFEREPSERHQAFADRHEVPCDTFRRWLYLLRAEKQGKRWRSSRGRRRRPKPPLALSLVEVTGAAAGDVGFEIEVPGGRRLRVPPSFDGAALRRLLAIFDEPPAS